MFTQQRLLAIGLLSGAASLAALAGCGDDDTGSGDTTSSSSSSGQGGSSTSSGSGGSGASGASGGAGGSSSSGGGQGGGFAVPSCAAYCADMAVNCVDTPQYIGIDGSCEAVCAQFESGSSIDPAGADVTGGTDTLACRAYHLSVAGQTDPDAHCPHSGPGGEDVCSGGSKGEAFCRLNLALCSGGNQVYPSVDDCIADLPNIANTGGAHDATQLDANTLNCRITHLTAASVDPDVHCQHIGGPNALTGQSDACVN